MLTVFDRPETSKELYFNLNNSLHLSYPPYSSTYKIAGLYALYRDGTCYYVGQSKNLPSRISTHLTGRYESCDEVGIYYLCESFFGDFYERTNGSQKEILENNEKTLINLLNPVENLDVDREFSIGDEYLFERFYSESQDIRPDATVYLSKFSVTVSDEPCIAMHDIDDRVFMAYADLLKQQGGE